MLAILPKGQVACYSQTQRRWLQIITVIRCMVVWCTQNVHQDDSSLTWCQPCNNQSAVNAPLGWWLFLKHAVWSCCQLFCHIRLERSGSDWKQRTVLYSCHSGHLGLILRSVLSLLHIFTKGTSCTSHISLRVLPVLHIFTKGTSHTTHFH